MEQIKNLAAALIEFQKNIGNIKKESVNPFFKSSYASLSDIIQAIKEPLIKCGLVVVQIPTGENELRTVIIHTESGETIEGTAKMLLTKQDPQGQGSAITYMRRYALGAMLGLNLEDDDDGNYASGNYRPASQTIKTPPKAKEVAKQPIQPKTTQSTPQVANQGEKCVNCGIDVPVNVASFSKSRFGSILCLACQKNFTKEN